MAGSNIKVSILGDWKNLQKTFNESQTGADKWAAGMSKAGTAMTVGVTAPIVAGAAAATAAAAEEAQEMEKLAGAIEKNIPGATKEAIDANEEWITSMQNASGIADSELRNSIQQLVQAGLPLEEAQAQTAAAMDIAAAKGVELSAVTNAMVKANNGNTTALGKLVGATKDASGEALTLDEMLQKASDTMGGSAATAADTAAGRAEIMKLKMGDLAESIGAILLPIMDKLVKMLTKIFDWFNKLSPGARNAVVAFGAVAAAIGPVLIVLGKVIALGPQLIAGFQAVGKAWGILSKLFMANPWILLIAATIALVVLIIANWDKIKKFLEDTWEAIKDGVEAVTGWIEDAWENLIDFFTGLPSRIASAVSGMWDGIKEAFRAAVNWIIGKWNNLSISLGGGSILGVDIPKITINTPNIPYFHQGGVYSAPAGRTEGLAMLSHGERILPAGTAGGMVNNITINAGMGADPSAISRAVVQALQRYERSNGAIPVTTRSA